VAPAATGADLGASGLRVLRLAQRGGQLEVVAAACTDLPVLPLAGSGERPRGAESAEDSAERLREVRTNLTSLLRRGPFRGGRSVLGLGGSSGLVRYLQVPPVPPWKMEMMMKYEVEEQSAAQERSAFDYSILDVPDVGGQLTVMLAMVQERHLRRLMEVAHRAGLARSDVDLSSLALYNAYVHGHGAEERGTALLVNIGAETLDIAVVRDGLLCFARSVPGGGSRFTAAVAEATGLTFEEAEKLKRDKGRILPPEALRGDPRSVPTAVLPGGAGGEGSGEGAAGAGEPSAGAGDVEIVDMAPPGGGSVTEVETKISAALTRELGVLAGVLDSSLMYCRAQTKQARLRPDEMLITGGGSMLPGFAEALARRMRMRVSNLEPFRRVSLGGLPDREVEEISADAPRFTAALGLAASRVVPGSMTLSMVPEDVKARRKFLESGLWMWYAAACVFLVGLLLGWSTIRREHLLDAERERLEQRLEEARDRDLEFRAIRAAAVQRRDEVQALEARIHSGRDIVQVMGLLKKCTGGPFLRNVVLAEIDNRAMDCIPDATTSEKQQSFQQERRVYVRGFADVKVKGRPEDTAAVAAASREALGMIEAYRKTLEQKGRAAGIVEMVRIRLYPAQPETEPLTESGIARHEFALMLVLAEPGAHPARPLVAEGGGK
jgi:type IV pilus assembly protein PilM